MNKIIKLIVAVSITFLMTGCGYKTGTLLPSELGSIHVKNFTNSIDVTREISDRRSGYSYRPGLETDITRTVISEFIFDGNLTVKPADKATLTLEGGLIDFRQYPLSYDDKDNVEEFRIELLVELKLINNLTKETMWKESSFMGEADYTVTGSNSKTEEEALKEAVKDLSERIVERTVEAW
ncbi:MAG: LPS assembly lipoprotein LptE [Candidatus Omnitrophota bacterium]